MTPPIDSEALKRVLVSLAPERPDLFPHPAHLSTDAELRFGVRAPGDWVLKQRSRSRHSTAGRHNR